ncbi:MAG: hypothetical protein LUE97_00075 [Oscillospiraceae bacterium]|nr:hypothetical protein [Oscillospiraceae bacterium]
MAIYVERNAPWMQWLAPERFADNDLFRIVTFFVFHSPCAELSSMCKSLEEYGWTTPWKKPFYLNKQLKQAATNPQLLFSADTYDTLELALDKANLKDNFPSDFTIERICFRDNMNNQFLSVFYHLRNAFAHCRLNMVDIDKECVFILEDMIPENNRKRYKLSARMILKKSTLLKWIDLIEGGERIYKYQNQ